MIKSVGLARSAAWRARLAERERDARDKLLAESTSDQVPVSHYRWTAEIAAAVTPDTIVVGDGGDVVGCASKFVPVTSTPARLAASAWARPSPSRPSSSSPTGACS
jgi:hypothetical protein